VLAGTPLIGNNKWPELPGFKAAVSRYYEAVFALGRTLFRGFALALGQPEDAFESLVTCPPSKLRLIHYPVDLKRSMRPVSAPTRITNASPCCWLTSPAWK
jgi:isopenicillin N synthase-like dioxygenase